MSQTYGDLQLKVIGVLQDQAGDLPAAEQDRLIQEAVRRYSKVRPREIVEDEVGNATHDLAVSLLAQWSEGFSVIRQVEYPVKSTDTDPPILEREDWIEYVKGATGRVLRLLNDAPMATETLRITYTALHLADEINFTIPEGDFDAVANWGASLSARSLANKYAQASEPTLQADSVDHRSKSQEYAARAKDLWRDVAAALNLDEDETAAGNVIVDWPAGQSWGWDWLTHERRKRG